jgi:glycerol-3-phosphate acyltransferase PlsY
MATRGLTLVARLIIAAALGYLAGSFPTGVLVTRLLGKPDPRFAGSGHTGGLNVYRLAGVAGILLTGLVDASKGVLAAWLALRLTGTPWALPAAGMGAVAGHCWSLYVGFAGGMGLGTLGGLFLWQGPLVVPAAAALWGLGALLLSDSPRGVMAMATVMVPVFWTLGRLGYLSPCATALGIGGVAIIFVRNLTELQGYDRRAPAE